MNTFRCIAKRFFSVFLMLIFSVLSGCSAINIQDKSLITGFQKVKIDESMDSLLKNNASFVEVAENPRYKLFIKGTTAEIKLVDKTTDVEWYSNPQNWLTDKYANTPISREKLMSQVDIEYNIVKTYSQNNIYTSYTDGILNNSVNYEKIENGVRVNYVIGKKPIIYLAPEIISIERAKEIRSKLSEEDKAFFDTLYKKVSLNDFPNPADRALKKANYPILAKRDVYIAQMQFKDPAGLGDQRYASSYLLSKISKMFERTGYTVEDLYKDNAENLATHVPDPDNTVNISIEYRIDKDGFTATIPPKSIYYDRNNIEVTKISLLPYFGAADDSKSGYIVLPDGSGALIYLNNNKTNMGSYTKKIYGADKTIDVGDREEQAYLPVFGIKADQTAFLAIIEKGDAVSEICADISGKTSQYNIVYARFEINANQPTLNQGVSAQKENDLRYQKELVTSDLSVRYLFMYGDSADYTDMALAYQKYLLDNKKIVKEKYREKIPLNINVVGSIIHKRLILGLPTEAPLKLTSFVETINILDQLKSKGVDRLVLQISNWCNNANLNYIYNKIDIINELGGEKGFNTLADYLYKNNIEFYPDTNFQYVSRNYLFSGYDVKKDASRTLNNIAAYNYDTNLTYINDESLSKRTVISPKRYAYYIERFLKDYKYKSLNLASIGTDLNSDYNFSDLIDRQEAKELVVKLTKELNNSGYRYVVNGGNIYTLYGASLINQAPFDSSNEYLCDETIPFYQIVMHGIKPYSSPPLNMSSDYETDVLKTIEYGMIPSFKWIYEDNDILTDTMSNFYSISYKDWLDKAVEVYKQVNASLSECQTATIVDHSKLKEKLIRVKYDNGIVVYINYNDTAQTADNIAINPRSFKVLKGVE